tara:strand:+ start:17 stop:670 length:654 start_codon:yes stop_codon:yes gene_type:complete
MVHFKNNYLKNKQTISIIDYGISNLGSIRNMLRKIGVSSNVITKPEQIVDAHKIILPGVGSFDHGVKALTDLNLIGSIKEAANKGIPLLGICLGMQLLGNKSEEGNLEGLGLIPGSSIKFNFRDIDSKYRIPHMGWNFISPHDRDHPFLSSLDVNSRFYFVHSYHFVPENMKHSIAKTSYGLEFTSIISSANVHGTQFHPEKSHKFGIQLLSNFSSI